MGGCSSKNNNKQTIQKEDIQRRRPSSVYSVQPSGGIDEINYDDNIDVGDDDQLPRFESSEGSISLNLGKLKIRYAYVSQRGIYPDDEFKRNQDSYSVTTNFNDSPHDAFFGVYDGHGRYGDFCSKFTSKHLPSLIAKQISTKQEKCNIDDAVETKEEISEELIESACATAHKQCNRALHKSQIDDSLSGTTAISCYIHGQRNKITVCNVGDSRAVLGSHVINRNGSNISDAYEALPLSIDQTPYRRDERKRIRKYGARILTLDQIEGYDDKNINYNDDDDDDNNNNKDLGKEIDVDGDPPRIWHPDHNFPGTAFTRSIGDSFAEKLGVFAEPEIITRHLGKGDDIIVLASDGVFEFLTSQNVINICAKYRDKDPLVACKEVVAESYSLWLQYELRTDDITMICMFIDSNDEYADKPMSEFEVCKSEKEDLLLKQHQQHSKPVRSGPSVEKSALLRKMSSMQNTNGPMDDEEYDITKLFTEKTEQEKACIAQSIRGCNMFDNITDEQRELIYKVMAPIDVKQGDWIIRQGSVGDLFYIVEEGSFEVRIAPENHNDKHNDGGTLVHVYEGSLENNSHPHFGELALLYSVPRAASIISRTDGKLWALHKSALRKLLVEQSGRQELLKVLRTVTALEGFSKEEVEYIAGTMKLETFGKGHAITLKGAKGDAFYVISKGQCGKFILSIIL